MGDRLQTGKASRHVTSHSGQLSLAIPPWVGAMNTSKNNNNGELQSLNSKSGIMQISYV